MLNELAQHGISLGDLLTTASFVITMLSLHRQNLRRVISIEYRVGLMWKHFAKRFDLPEDLDEAARQEH